MPKPGVEVPPILDDPTKEEILKAVLLILKPIAEFPFVTEDDRATWIGLALTPILRPLFPPPVSDRGDHRHQPRHREDTAGQPALTLHGGMQRGEMPRDDAELRKTITSTLMTTTAPIVLFDNLAGTVKSPVLDGLLTAKTWTDRWLGRIQNITAANDRLWLATGNNAQFGGDLARRIAMVSIDPPGRITISAPTSPFPTWTTGWWSTGASTWRPSSPWHADG